MKILFIRHAEKVEDKKKASLTEKGFKQAKYLAKELNKMQIDEFYCSELTRARQTSEIVSKKIKMIPKIEESLDEYDSEFLKTNFKKAPKEIKERLSRLKKFLKQITKNPETKKTILIISHGGTNRIILSELMKLKLSVLIPFMQSETNINEMKWNKKNKNWRLIRWGNNSHLPKKLR